MTDLIDELLETSSQNLLLGKITFVGRYGVKKFELDVNKHLSLLLKKQLGHYVTIKFSKSFLWSKQTSTYISNLISKSTKQFVSDQNPKTVLFVGLGNGNMVCDSLGKLVCSKLVLLDDQFAKFCGVPKFCVFLPSVSGLTNLNSFDLIKSVVKQTKPDLVVAIDSLAARDVSRLGFSVQLSNAGILPGGGVGNSQNYLSQKTLGVPVLSVGVPLLISLEDLGVSKKSFYMHFTPKEIDIVVEKCSKIVADALNNAFYQKSFLKSVC